MRLGGVDIPYELLEAHRDGSLVLFVGAGVSVDSPSCLPLFLDMSIRIAKQAYHPAPVDSGTDLDVLMGRLKDLPTKEEQQRLLRGTALDVLLGKLNDRGVDVHGQVRRIIGRNGSAPNELHRTVVDLACKSTTPRIITTNYDLHLDRIMTETAPDECQVFSGPALPLGDDFSGLVHLHGSLEQESRQLVVTDRDFAAAYLTEGWATRFLLRMFETNNVLFIGYSVDDMLMQYIARGLKGAKQSYILHERLTKNETERYEQLNRLGVKMLEYDPIGETDDPPRQPQHVSAEAGQQHDPASDLTQPPTVGHVGLFDCLSAWGHLMGMSQLDHARQAQEYLVHRPSGIPEDSDYIESLLQDETLVQHFTAHAKRRDWVEWFCRTDVFSEMLEHSHDSERLNTLRRWYGGLCTTGGADELPVSEASRTAVGKLAARRAPPNSVMRMSVLRALGSNAGELTDMEVSWLLWVLQDSPHFGFQAALIVNQAVLMQILERCDIGSQTHVGLEILHHLLRLDMHLSQPYATDRLPDLFLPDSPSALTLERDGVERINETVQAWIDAKPASVLEIAATHIARTVRPKGASNSTGSSHDSISFSRRAIEPHPQDMIRSLVDDVIDIARDSLVCLCEVDSGRAGAWIDGALYSEAALLRRIAVHGLGRHNSRSADERLQIVADFNLLNDIYLHHEIFQLIANLASEASAGMLDRLVGHIADSWEQHDGE